MAPQGDHGLGELVEAQRIEASGYIVEIVDAGRQERSERGCVTLPAIVPRHRLPWDAAGFELL